MQICELPVFLIVLQIVHSIAAAGYCSCVWTFKFLLSSFCPLFDCIQIESWHAILLKCYMCIDCTRLVNDNCKYYRQYRYRHFLIRLSTILMPILSQKLSVILLLILFAAKSCTHNFFPWHFLVVTNSAFFVKEYFPVRIFWFLIGGVILTKEY